MYVQESRSPFFSVDTFLTVGPYSSVQKTQFEILSFPPKRRANICLCWYGFFHTNWTCAAFLLSELKWVKRASPVQVSVASFYDIHFKDRLLRRDISWMMVIVIQADKAQQNCSVCIPICRFPWLQVLCCPPSLYNCTMHTWLYLICRVTAICTLHTAVIMSNIAIKVLFLFGFILGLDIVWVSDSWHPGVILSQSRRPPSFTTTDMYQCYNCWSCPTMPQLGSSFSTRIRLSMCFLFLCIPSAPPFKDGLRGR